MGIREELQEVYDEALLFADGLDDAIIGVDEWSSRVIYSKSLCIQCMMDEGMDEQEAIEYLDFNTFSAYVGEKTPIWCDDIYLKL
jgi:hypothetical protein